MKTAVKDVMTTSVVTVTPTTGFRVLAALMRDRGITGLPVVDVEGRLVGVVSEADLLLREERPLPAGRDDRSWSRREERAKATSTVASGLMSRYVVTVRPEDSIAEAARLMHRHAVQRLPVVDAAGRLFGIVSRGDLLKVFLRSDDEIRRDVLADLTAGGVPTDLVRVSVGGGVVILEGDLADEPTLRQIEEIAGAVDGVVGVRSSIPRVPSPGAAE
jgi:CBS domain-containing protein